MTYLIEIRDGDVWHSSGFAFNDRAAAEPRIERESKAKVRIVEVENE